MKSYETCYVFSCDRKPWANGLCVGHFTRLARTGSVQAFKPLGLPHGRTGPVKVPPKKIKAA